MSDIRSVMTPDPTTIDAGESLTEAAVCMRDGDIGNVLVTRDGQLCGIVTDRDLVVRGLAGGSASSLRVGDVCSSDLTCVSPDDSVDDVRAVMESKALRRVPVVDGGRAIGIVSLGDLAVKNEAGSALEGISEAPPNN